ncbi:MAG: hypothetical protein OXH05_00285 [Acidobacteria bacterium]|nr:hypothetical protein [Acidobacteriota bacterium]
MIENKARLSRWDDLNFPDGTPAHEARALAAQVRRDGWRVHRANGNCLVISEVPTTADPPSALMTALESAPVNPAGLSALAEVVHEVRAWDSGWQARFPAGLERLKLGDDRPSDSRLFAYPIPEEPRLQPPRPGFLPFRGAPTYPPAPPAPPAIAAFDFLGGESMRSGRGVTHEARLVVHVLGNLSPAARKGGTMTPQYFSAAEMAHELWAEIPRGGRAIRMLRRALDRMTRLEAGPITLPDGTLAALRPLMIGAIPYDLDGSVEIFVRMPPNPDGRGFRYDRMRARHWGRRSAPHWRLYLGACYLRDRFAINGRGIELTIPQVQRGPSAVILDAAGNPVFTKGQPVRDWHHPKATPTGQRIPNPAARSLSVYSLEDLSRLASGPAPDTMTRQARYRRRRRTEEALDDLQEAGDLEYELADDPNGRRGFRVAAVDPRRRHRRLTE